VKTMFRSSFGIVIERKVKDLGRVSSANLQSYRLKIAERSILATAAA
jgi:hypothetical protein